MKTPILLTLLLIILLGSCNSYKRLTYLQDIGRESDTLYQKQKETYRLQPADILYVRIITMDEEINKYFNPLLLQGSGNISQMQTENLYLMGFEVQNEGYIEMPILKKIYVQGLSLTEAQDSIASVAYRFLKDPQVIVKMHTFQFTILGEVKTPGLKEYGTSEMNILEAIALAGDITYNGNRENIVIMRPGQDNYQVRRLDLTDKNLVGSDQFYIQPNDIIYVEPLRSTLFRETTSDYMFFVSAISGVLSLTVLVLRLL
jgi:polysaccharide export outer membrane protein